MATLMKAAVFAKKLKYVAENTKTLYVMGGWGQPLTESNKKMFIKNYSFNQKSDRYAAIMAATPDTFAFDCVCFDKSMLDGFCGDATQQFGGATYGKPCPDVTIKDLLNRYCTDISTDMAKIQTGEFIVYKDYSHCGVYVGDNLVVECTYRWEDGVQFTNINQAERKDMWGFHGKLTAFLDYEEVPQPTPNPSPKPDNSAIKTELNDCIVEMSSVLQRMNTLVNKL